MLLYYYYCYYIYNNIYIYIYYYIYYIIYILLYILYRIYIYYTLYLYISHICNLYIYTVIILYGLHVYMGMAQKLCMDHCTAIWTYGRSDPVLEAQPIAGRKSLQATLEHLAVRIPWRYWWDLTNNKLGYWRLNWWDISPTDRWVFCSVSKSIDPQLTNLIGKMMIGVPYWWTNLSFCTTERFKEDSSTLRCDAQSNLC